MILHNKLTWYIRRTLWRFGLDIARTPNLKKMLAECDFVIDAGANCGDSYDYFRSLGYKGMIYSFEPSPDAFQKMTLRTGCNWVKYNTCLSDKYSVVPFYIRKTGDDSWNGLSRMSNRTADETAIFLNTMRLDNCKTQDGKAFLKIDCEGHDIAVLRGASGVDVRYVLMEVPVAKRFDTDLSFIESMVEIKKLGFELVSVLGNIHSDDASYSQALDLIFKRVDEPANADSSQPAPTI